MTPSLAAVCAVVFSLVSTDHDLSADARATAGGAVETIVTAAPDIDALDAEVQAIFSRIEKDEGSARTLVAKSLRPCVDHVKSLRGARYD